MARRTLSSLSARFIRLRSSRAIRSSSSSSSSNFRLVPLAASVIAASPFDGLSSLAPPPPLAEPFPPSNPICTLSNSLTLLCRTSSSSRLWLSSPSSCLRSASFSNRLISLRCASKLLTAHSRQKTSPCGQATASVASFRHSWQEPKGRKESRDRRVDWEPQVFLRRERSCEVKKASEVLRLPGRDRQL